MIEATDRKVVHSFFHERLGLHWSEDFRGVLHVPSSCADAPMCLDDVVMGVAYNGFVGRVCCMHYVVQRPALVKQRMLRDAFHFAFNVCGCEAVIGFVDSNNHQALRVDKKLGFREVMTIPNGGPEGDMIVFQMLRGDCKWLQEH